ncbi:MAG TPA: hypothetical protein DCZ13_07380 [Porticoccaceae bacterium]|nr:hypothetical protein [Porticoccaceae bacterium]
MPIYEYTCSSCQRETEVIQKISEGPLEICPHCNEKALTKKLTASAFRLSGSGWYETDFKTGDKKNLAGDKSGDGKNSTDTKSGDSGSGSSGSVDKSSSTAGNKSEKSPKPAAKQGA